MIVLGIDPGKTTGYAVLRAVDGRVYEIEIGELEELEFFARVEDLVSVANAVACENFRVSQSTLKKNPGQYWSIEQRGLLRYLAWKWDLPFEVQDPNEALDLVSNDRLKKLRLYHRGEQHGRDATRHGVLYLVEKKLIDLRSLL